MNDGDNRPKHFFWKSRREGATRKTKAQIGKYYNDNNRFKNIALVFLLDSGASEYNLVEGCCD
jgi:hypothetical protein